MSFSRVGPPSARVPIPSPLSTLTRASAPGGVDEVGQAPHWGPGGSPPLIGRKRRPISCLRGDHDQAVAESATVWRTSDRLYHAVSVPMVTAGDLKGVLVAGYALNEALAVRHPEADPQRDRFRHGGAGRPPRSSRCRRSVTKEPLCARPGPGPSRLRSSAISRSTLPGIQHVGIEVPLKTATGERWGRSMALRSRTPRWRASAASATAWSWSRSA